MEDNNHLEPSETDASSSSSSGDSSMPSNSATTAMANDASSSAATIEELLMRHSSPLLLDRAATSDDDNDNDDDETAVGVVTPLSSPQVAAIRRKNSSPSPLRLNRPRSNPRVRTPMRIDEHNEDDDDDDDNDEDDTAAAGEGDGRRITITSFASRRARQQDQYHYYQRQQQQQRPKSQKQGPSHRKARRKNNDNFVNLAAELTTSNGSTAAAVEALLSGSAEASKFRSILDPTQHESKSRQQFRDDTTGIRDRFFEGTGGGGNGTAKATTVVVVDYDLLTPLERFHRIENRLRRIVVKACENSYAASKVVNTLEEFLIRTSQGQQDNCTEDEWKEFLVEPPIVYGRSSSSEPQHQTHKISVKFLFDEQSSTGGFHRLLLHGLCQYHCLRASSSTMQISSGSNINKKARVLIATGTMVSGVSSAIRLVDFITERQEQQKELRSCSSSTCTTTEHSNFLKRPTNNVSKLTV